MATTIARSFAPHGYVPSQPTQVYLDVVVDPAQTATFFIDEMYPAGWTVSDIGGPVGGSDNGVTVRWFAMYAVSGRFEYKVTPPLGTTGQHAFAGELIGDKQPTPGPHTIPATGETALDEFTAARHPCDTNLPDWMCTPAEVLAWASVWLAGGELSFQGTPLTGGGVSQAYILRSAAITLAYYEARYEDLGSLDPINDTGHPQRWQALPDEVTTTTSPL